MTHIDKQSYDRLNSLFTRINNLHPSTDYLMSDDILEGELTEIRNELFNIMKDFMNVD